MEHTWSPSLPTLHQSFSRAMHNTHPTMFLHLLLIFLFSLLSSTNASPLPPAWTPPIHDPDALHNTFAPSWVKEPLTRGTFGIVFPCLATLGLCVYTGIHLNIPAQTDGQVKIIFRKLKWSIIALFAPEMVLYCAWQQWFQAKAIMDRMNAALDRKAEIEQKPVDESYRYDISMAYWVVMGGFVYKCPRNTGISDGAKGFREDEKGEVTRVLTPAMVVALAEDQLARGMSSFLMVDAPQREDKNKADALAKLLVVGQVCWMVIQVLARVVMDYPVSLLEIHTFVHVICGLIMYFLWFNKLQGVNIPNYVTLNPQQISVLSGFQGWNQSYHPARIPNIQARGDSMNGLIRLNRKPVDDRLYLALVCAMYGGVHLTAWYSYFPTVLEKWFWRASCFAMLIGALSAPSLVLMGEFMALWRELFPQKRFWTGMIQYCFNLALKGVGDKVTLARVALCMYRVFAVMWILPYLVARMYLVVEPFASLRHMPAGVYAVVSWSLSVPHII
ncbi:hypothetical protein BZA77DRAFT_279406 [Pyronema omphalodes]|nr:hypothetical protein BZA77DRAFT_279406 [Pyronema omphalodes]